MNEKAQKLLQGLNTLQKLMDHQEKARKTTLELNQALTIKTIEEVATLLDGPDQLQLVKLVKMLKATKYDTFERAMNIIENKESVENPYLLRLGTFMDENAKITVPLHNVLKMILNARTSPEYSTTSNKLESLVSNEPTCGQ